MRAKPSSNTRAATSRSSRANVKPKGVVKKSKEAEKKAIPDLSVLRQPVDTSVCGLKQAVKVFETGTPEVLHLLTYDCDVVYECKVCRNLFRSIANFISHKRIYCTLRYSRSQDLRSNKEAENYTVIVGEKATEKLPTRITARKDLTSIVESITGQTSGSYVCAGAGENGSGRSSTDKKPTTVHLEPIENTSYGVFQTVLKPNSEELMRNQVTELQKLLSQNEVILGPDGRILQNGFADLPQEETGTEANEDDENTLICSTCNTKFANRKTLLRHKRMIHESVRASYSCPCCKNYFANPWSVYRHLYKVHRKTNEQVRRLRSQIHKRDVKVDKPVVNNVNNKKLVSPSKKKVEAEMNQKFQQDNKEWMDHFEDDWELQRCGGCGRKFERKAALISHSQICQKRIAAYNRIEHNHPAPSKSVTPVVALSPISCSKKPVPKPSPEKKIGIQVRMNYCKNTSASATQVKPRSVLSDESDVEALSVDGKESFFQPLPIKNSIDMKESSVLEEFFKNANKCCNSEGVDKVQSYLNHSPNGIDKVHTYEISTCKRSTFLRSNIGKSKSLEAKCLQLRNALENGISDSSNSDKKEKDLETTLYLDGNVDNTSESNTSAISSLSSQLTPLVDKGYVCEVEESIEIKNINISRTVEKIPSTEADSTSTGLHMTFNSHTYTGNIKFSPNGDATCEEVSTSVISDEIPQLESSVQVDSSYQNDDEISVDLKPITFLPDESKSFQESELENTISILTRNQLKAICRDDFTPAINEDKKVGVKKNGTDAEVEAATREMSKKKLHRYADLSKNTCSICKKKFKKLQDVYRHIPTHTRWKRYECLYNGCTFQTFLKKTCLHHVTLHTKDSSDLSSDSLVGIISPSKWNLRLVENIPPTRVVSKIVNVPRNKDTASTKLFKTVNRLSKRSMKPSISDKTKLDSKVQKIKIPKDARKIKMSKFLTKVGTKQKLLTEFKSFSKMSKFNGKNMSQTNKIKKPIIQTSKRKANTNSISPGKKKSTPAENGVSNKEDSSPKAGKPAVKRPRFSNTVNSPKAKREAREDEIIVNHITVDNSELNIVKGRGSRTSSRKSSVNSVDQQKAKNLTNPVVKGEDPNLLHFTSFANETQTPVNFQNPEIVDGSSSMEEEESQESDRTVDDSHLKKIFMEVIFGPGPTTAGPGAVQSPGRPVRNKSRPKRDSDFILGGSKDSEREMLEGKFVSSKKPNKPPPPDSRAVSEISRKSK